ncbi:hypothetical protein K469DRAFT_558069 [Zopfia rhizophila CBS 207.26]|uniref:Mediator of RNA polymerase II transcription subunit 17 n=1 Tax=Zopfia rhizophila CBS 207.26 TaxID=1314779 RepID=A0A6A6EI69_9PEZI|nr:hypothetical protein K469DRAFT_558069 [Zopfia rhizophila CBS 207.26]
MSGAGSATQVTLRPWPTAEKEDLEPFELDRLLLQLTNERGHLRSITEKTLQDEVDSGRDVAGDVMEGVEQDEKKDAPKLEDKLKEIAATKSEMWRQLEIAIFYARNGLDMNALLLSKEANKHLESSLSPAVRANIPKTALGVTNGPAVEQEEGSPEEKQRELVARGSRMEALDSAADSILKAATRLETEVRKETKYWNELLSISQKGWSIQRFRRDIRHSPFAVRYGFSEASDHFKGRGLAPLRIDKDGSIILDPALALRPKTLRVRVSEDGMITGTSSLPAQEEGSSLAIEKSIQLARDSLFEEEIYYEISLESRGLLPYEVELRNSVIHLPAPGFGGHSQCRKLLIDCIPRDAPIPESENHAENHTEDWLAQNVAEALRVLLAHEHRMRLYRRSQPPAPLTQNKRPSPTPPLLHTLLAFFSHIKAVDSLQHYLDATSRTLSSAGLPAVSHVTRETTWENLSKTISESRRRHLSAIDKILELFSRPFDGVATLTLPSSHESRPEEITIATRTYFGNPTFGFEYKVTLPPSSGSALSLPTDHKREFKFSSVADLESYLDWILSLDLSHALVAKEHSGRLAGIDRKSRVSLRSKEGKKRIQKDVIVQFAHGSLMVKVEATELFDRPPPNEREYSWDGTHGKSSFRDKIKSLVGPN